MSGSINGSIAPEIHEMVTTETRIVSVSFTNKLNSGELLTGTPTVAEETSSDLVITNKAVNTAIVSINGIDVPIGQAVQFLVDAAAATANELYNVDILCSTDASPAQVLNGEIRIRVRGT